MYTAAISYLYFTGNLQVPYELIVIICAAAVGIILPVVMSTVIEKFMSGFRLIRKYHFEITVLVSLISTALTFYWMI